MLKRIKKVMMSGLASLMLLFPIVAPVSVYAADGVSEENDIIGGLQCGTEFEVEELEGTPQCDPGGDAGGASTKVNEVLTLVINIFSLIVGVVAVIMIIIGGLKYITSGGDSGNVTGAKNTIMYAVIGLIVVALAQFLVRFVLEKAVGVGSN